MDDKLNVVILAAGKGTRLGLETPKPLLPFLNINLIHQVINVAKELTSNLFLSIIVGHKKEDVVSYVDSNFPDLFIEYIHQNKQLGTGHAIQEYLTQTSHQTDNILILCADTPLITKSVLTKLVHFKNIKNLLAAGLSFNAENPFGYGRIQRVKNQLGLKIVEEKDTSTDQKLIKEVNSGIYLVEREYLKLKIKNIDNNNKSGEFYLTDIFDQKQNCDFLEIENGSELFLGVNTMSQLEQTESIARSEIIKVHQSNGVRFIDSSTVFIDPNVKISSGVTIMPNVHLRGNSSIGSNCLIEVGTIIIDSEIADEVIIFPYSVIEKSKINKRANVGPFARIRPESIIGEECKIGNFVETKKATFKEGAKVSHLSYVGDAMIGKGTNIGCGFITCNYDGKNKHQTNIGQNCFIGSDSQMIAPVNIGDNCFVASGSTISRDLKDGDFAISRSRQVIKEGMAKKFLKK